MLIKRVVRHTMGSMLVRVGKINFLAFFLHTDPKDFKDCYAASGYAI